MLSERLLYRPLELSDVDTFHRLVQDAHIRRYMMDGNILPPEWAAEQIQASQDLFERRGVGTWLVSEKNSETPVGFCGFQEVPLQNHEPELAYALLEQFAGQGYASEMARACISHARTHANFKDIIASVDEANSASVRVLEKLGFQRIETRQGAFGNLFIMRLAADASI
jgi:RimJ/RimL family protein N-acetyltransferase